MTQINYKGTGIRIDGGGSLADMESFLLELGEALEATLADEEKFNRLAEKVIEDTNPPNKDNFRESLEEVFDRHQRYNDSNIPLHGDQTVHYGYGRLDAFGRIYNQILTHLMPSCPCPTTNPANAPVSYPFLWDIAQHDFVQWNGVAGNNSGSVTGFFGPLGRNVGEVLGVFATFSLERRGIEAGYRSSVDRRNLNRLEEQVTYLQSPVWSEEILPKINRSLAEEGQRVFAEYECGSCHKGGVEINGKIEEREVFDRADPKRRVIAQFSSTKMIGTDPLMADNGIDLKGKSGLFKGKNESPDRVSDKFGEETSAFAALSRAVTYVILEPDHDKGWLRRGGEWTYDLLTAALSNPIKKVGTKLVDFEVFKVGEKEEKNMELLRAYKGRTLNGIWATGPYLHNGSIPNLYELFLPACTDEEVASGQECRSNRFTVGSREFDPVRVGLVSKSSADYPGLYTFDTSLPSNSNAGHEYASGETGIIVRDAKGLAIRDVSGEFKTKRFPPMSKEKREALVEYLKTL
jgi:hypothetical protein